MNWTPHEERPEYWGPHIPRNAAPSVDAIEKNGGQLPCWPKRRARIEWT